MVNRNDFFPSGRRVPDFYQTLLARFGRNLLGENLYRLIWSSSRAYWVGGWWEVEQEFGYKRMPKYPGQERWMIEKWMPPQTYGSPEVWNAGTLSREGFLQVGPFPAHGEYESAAVFSVGPGTSGYVPLEPGTVELQARLIHLGRTRSMWDIRDAIRSEQEIKAKHQDSSFEEMWQSVQHTRKGLTIGVAGSYSEADAISEYKRKLLLNQHAWLPQSQFQKGFSQDAS